DELVRAVATALSGCPATPQPTATPSPSPSPTETSSPTPSPTFIGLGVRRFSIDPESSPLTAVLGAGKVASTLPGFSGFLELSASEPDPSTGFALVDVTDA